MFAQTYPQLSSEHDDLPSRLLFTESPFHQVLPALPGKGHVPPGHRRVGGPRQDMWLRLVVCVHPISVDDTQGVIIAHLVTVPQLVFGNK